MSDPAFGGAPPPRVAWLLGAGFSRALGAPLLKDLLAMGEVQRTLDHVQFVPEHKDSIHAAAKTLKKGLRTKDSDGFWADAEEFLEILDTACQHETSLGNFIRRIGGGGANPSVIRAGAVRCIAAQCEAFMRLHTKTAERVGPYLRWLETLVAADHAIITTNYDLVVEKVAEWANRKINVSIDGIGASDAPSYYKLHGCVSWRWKKKDDGTSELRTQESLGDGKWHCVARHDREFTIGTPGQQKGVVAERFKTIWDGGERALSAAAVVVFMGYRFPPTDAYARLRLLGAIARNKRPRVEVHVVLPPDSEDRERLNLLLEHSMHTAGRTTGNGDRSYRIIHHRLGAEDFLSVASPDLFSNNCQFHPAG